MRLNKKIHLPMIFQEKWIYCNLLTESVLIIPLPYYTNYANNYANKDFNCLSGNT